MSTYNYSDTSSCFSLVHVRPTLTHPLLLNSRDWGTALVLGCSHRTVIPAVALRAFSRGGQVMDEFPFCGLWMPQEIKLLHLPWLGGRRHSQTEISAVDFTRIANRFDHPTCRRSRQEKISNRITPVRKIQPWGNSAFSDCTCNGPEQLEQPTNQFQLKVPLGGKILYHCIILIETLKFILYNSTANQTLKRSRFKEQCISDT